MHIPVDCNMSSRSHDTQPCGQWLQTARTSVMVIGSVILLTLATLLPVEAGMVGYEPENPHSFNTRVAHAEIEWINLRGDGLGYGRTDNHLDAEVIFKLKGRDEKFGFKVRPDKFLPIRYAMLDRLNEAYRNNASVKIEYRYDHGKTIYEVHSVATWPKPEY